MAPRLKAVHDVKLDQELRRAGGLWLKDLRERAGHTQRSFAIAVGVDYYTFISQIETGRGAVPKDRYTTWAEHLGLHPREFLRQYMEYFDPVSYNILFGPDSHVELADGDKPAI